MKTSASLLLASWVGRCAICLGATEANYEQAPEAAVSVSVRVMPAEALPPRDAFHVLPGFKVERVFAVPRAELGSWVSMTLDGKGRILVADQGNKGICRVMPAPLDGSGPTRAQRLELSVPGAQGLLYAFGNLYISVNSQGESGLFRARDTDGDDQFDELVKLKAFNGPSGEHGPHALRLAPDGKSIYIIAGNHTDLPFNAVDAQTSADYSSELPTTWGEDFLLGRIWDPNGHARGRMAPGGWIARTDPEGKTWRIVSAGYRNAYDFDFNADGELFTYDSDMEWDMGLPWYRPTRVVHASGGSEFGWRSGSGVWPAYFVDSLPPLMETGPGSPTGVTFGYGTRFPAKYQRALFLCDWTFGTIYALHLEPEGSTYKATREEFLSRTPLALTDILVGPDGALYFIVGGRNTQSEMYRVTYVGDESTEPVDGHDARYAEQRAARRKLEQAHETAANEAQSKEVVDAAWAQLGSDDRFLQYAARVALEFQPAALWQDRVLAETESPTKLVLGAVSLAHRGDKAFEQRLLEALGTIALDKLSEQQQLDLLRAYELVFIRMGQPDDAARQRLIEHFDPLYPTGSDYLNRELSALLVYLQSPTVVEKTLRLLAEHDAPAKQDPGELLERNTNYGRPIAAMLANQPDAQLIHYAFVLRAAREGWTFARRQAYFAFLRDAALRSGGNSFQGFLRSIGDDAYVIIPEDERKLIDATGIRQPLVAPDLPKPKGPGRPWTLDELVDQVGPNLKQRNFQNGKRAYAAARCVVCHRFAGEGGSTGPDLTQLAGRFGVKELAEAIVDPSKTVSDQYRAYTVQTSNGKSFTGRILSDTNDSLLMLVDPEDRTKVVQVGKEEIESRSAGNVSLMPADLLKPLNADEVLDLFAFLLSRGEADDPMFQK